MIINKEKALDCRAYILMLKFKGLKTDNRECMCIDKGSII